MSNQGKPDGRLGYDAASQGITFTEEEPMFAQLRQIFQRWRFECWMRKHRPHVKLARVREGRYANWGIEAAWESWQLLPQERRSFVTDQRGLAVNGYSPFGRRPKILNMPVADMSTFSTT